MTEKKIDVKLLKKWINPYYLQQHILMQLPDSYKRDSIIQLRSFLHETAFKELKKQLARTKLVKKSIPDQYVYKEIDLKQLKDFAAFLNSPTFKQYLKFITGLQGKKAAYSLKVFGHSDYTLLHDKEKGWNGVDLLLDITDDWEQSWGGYVRYSNSEGTLFTLVPHENTLTLLKRTSDMHSFVKYVNAAVGKQKRVFVEGIIK